LGGCVGLIFFATGANFSPLLYFFCFRLFSGAGATTFGPWLLSHIMHVADRLSSAKMLQYTAPLLDEAVGETREGKCTDSLHLLPFIKSKTFGPGCLQVVHTSASWIGAPPLPAPVLPLVSAAGLARYACVLSSACLAVIVPLLNILHICDAEQAC
jgi:hypothetical protein